MEYTFSGGGWEMVNHILSPYSVGSAEVFKREKDDSHDLPWSTAYNDRLGQFDSEKYSKALIESGVKNRDLWGSTIEQLDAFLTSYFDYPCRVFFVEVQRGMNGYDVVRMDYQQQNPQTDAE